MGTTFACCRDLFDAASEASRDIDRCNRMLDAMEDNAMRVSSPSLEPHVSASHDPDRIGGRVAAMVDAEDKLRRRMEEDYALIDAACAILYGRDSDEGLCKLVPAWWCDSAYQHYINGLPWEQVGAVLGYSPHHARLQALTAFDVADANGFLQTVAGMGSAEG